MSTPPPLPPELEAFLAPHRTVSPLPASVEARAIARAAATVEWSSALGRRLALAGPQRWVFAAAAGTVVVAGAAAYAARGWIGAASPPAPETTVVAPSAPRASSAGPWVPAPSIGAPETTVPDSPIPAEAPRRRRVVGRTGAAPVRASHAELQLLRMAREDVTNGDYAEALTIIGEHSRRFRNGGLVEEREALRVKSLAGLGRLDEARRAAAELRARFPRSVFLPTFERIQGSGRGLGDGR